MKGISHFVRDDRCYETQQPTTATHNMKQPSTIEVTTRQRIATVWLSRAGSRNALNEQLVKELLGAFDMLEADHEVRVVVLRGRGDYFCAGGDLKWMNGGDELPVELHPATWLSRLFARLYRFPKPVVTLVHGAALGGAMGLVAASDFVIAEQGAVFSFTELKLGLIPAVISPFVIKRIGEFRSRKLMLSARKISAEEALNIELIDYVSEISTLEKQLQNLCAELMQGAPLATQACKQLIVKVAASVMDDALFDYTARQLKTIQQGAEAKEGIAAFFEKRTPAWEK